MIPMSAIVLNWSGRRLTEQQMFVVQDAALEFDNDHEGDKLMFENPVCDGVIECKGRMTHGIYRGVRFIAYLDADEGTTRSFEFLLTDYYTKSELRSNTKFQFVHPAENKQTTVEASIAKRTRTTAVRRSRAN